MIVILPFRGLGATTQVQAIAQAIATAEGGLIPGTLPYRTNNPCDVFAGGSTAGYATMDAGWQACYNQVNAILGDTSSYYSSDEPVTSIAQTYVCGSGPCAAGDNPSNWAAAVAQQLGISPSDPLTAYTGVPASPLSNPLAVGDGSGAETGSDSATGLETPNSGSFDLSTLSNDINGVQFVDSSGNLTGWGWAGIGLVAVLGIWAVAR